METSGSEKAGDVGKAGAAEAGDVGTNGGAVVPAVAGLPFAGALIRAGSGVSSETLGKFLPSLRPGDPLGLGLDPRDRPEAPPDPDKYDLERENAEFARSLMQAKERKQVDDEIAARGYMPIDAVRAFISENTIKGDTVGLDPEIMMLIDARTNYKIFVAGDNLYTREELYAFFPFHELNVQPEAVFVQQEIGVFPPRKYAIKDGELEYIARDVGDESVDFVMIEDLVGQAARADYKTTRAPLKIAKTKIYIGKERWEDFSLLQRVFRGVARVAHAQLAYGANSADSAGGIPLLALLGGRRSEPMLLADRETLEAERKEQARREAELQRREEEQRAREEELQRHLEAAQKKIDADLRRIEAMFAAVSHMGSSNIGVESGPGLNTKSSPTAESAPPTGTAESAPPTGTAESASTMRGPDPGDDSVPL
jgi:hypothetical protein